MTSRDTIVEVRLHLKSGVVDCIVEREFLNDDGSVNHAIILDGAHGQSPTLDDKPTVERAVAFVDTLVPDMEARHDSADMTVHDAVKVVDDREAAKAAALADAAEAAK